MHRSHAFDSRLLVLWLGLTFLLGCAATPTKEPQIERISAEEIEKLMPKPFPNLTLDEIVRLSKEGVVPELIIEKIKVSDSRYDLTPSQSVELSKQGVDIKVLDYIYAAREQALRESFADEINRLEKEQRLAEKELVRELQWRSQLYYSPFWGYGYQPYWRWRSYPFYGW